MNLEEITPFKLWLRKNRYNNKLRKLVVFRKNSKGIFLTIWGSRIRGNVSFKHHRRLNDKEMKVAFKEFYKNNELTDC